MDSIEPRERTSLWTGLAVGLGAAALLGVGLVIFVLLQRRKGDGGAYGLYGSVPRQLAAAPSYPMIPAVQDNAILLPPSVPAAVTPTVIRTAALPTTGTVRLYTASAKPCNVVVRSISPAGAFAVLGYDPAAVGADTGLTPTGETFVLPIGAAQRFYLNPRQALYGRGSAASVVVSIAASENLTTGVD